MWRRIYLVLWLVRFYFALSPSYIHPDENFQGPEIITGALFPYPSHKTWEWTSAYPIRSVFPLWPVYGLPMAILKWVWADNGDGLVSPEAVYYALRVVMFTLSFVLEDWAIYELVRSPRHRSEAVALVTSSYVTWTFQTHTFSNSVETLLVAWSLVLIDRITNQKSRSAIGSCIVLAFLTVFGVFNRITFPAFILIPGLRLLPHFSHRPFTGIIITVSGILFTFLAIATDTAFFNGPASTASFRALFAHIDQAPVVTPLNNVRYNSQTTNLAAHGLHPHYQHLLVNLPQLLGPALILLITLIWPFTLDNLRATLTNPRLTSAMTGILLLSIIPHQEPRFLIPCIPLLLTCIRIPSTPKWRQRFWISWILFNAFMGILMGLYHQGGVIPAQITIPSIIDPETTGNVTAFWWKTYPPPTYLLGSDANTTFTITSTTLMGMPEAGLKETLQSAAGASSTQPLHSTVYLVAPLSAHLFDNFHLSDSNLAIPPPEAGERSKSPFHLHLEWSYSRHINLDDIDILEDGFFGTLRRVVGRRGIGIWRVTFSDG